MNKTPVKDHDKTAPRKAIKPARYVRLDVEDRMSWDWAKGTPPARDHNDIRVVKIMLVERLTNEILAANGSESAFIKSSKRNPQFMAAHRQVMAEHDKRITMLKGAVAVARWMTGESEGIALGLPVPIRLPAES